MQHARKKMFKKKRRKNSKVHVELVYICKGVNLDVKCKRGECLESVFFSLCGL